MEMSPPIATWVWCALAVLFTALAVWARRMRDGRTWREIRRDARRDETYARTQAYLSWPLDAAIAVGALAMALWQTFG